MFEFFFDSFNTTFLAVLRIFIVVFVAGVIIRKKIMTSEHLSLLSTSVVLVFLPCFAFSNIIKNFNPIALPIWPILPLSAFFLVGIGLIFAFILFGGQFKTKKDMFALSSMQNAGYFILPLGEMLFPLQIDEFRLYCLLFIIGLNPILWSLGKYFISGGQNAKFSIKELITPPLIANISALVLVLIGAAKYIPSVIVDSAGLLGEATVPVATFVLGGVLGGLSIKINHYFVDAAKTISIKMFAVPATTIAILYWTKAFNEYPLLETFLVLQASSAPAIANILQVKHYGGNENKIGTITLLNYITALFSVPLFAGIWELLKR